VNVVRPANASKRTFIGFSVPTTQPSAAQARANEKKISSTDHAQNAGRLWSKCGATNASILGRTGLSEQIKCRRQNAECRMRSKERRDNRQHSFCILHSAFIIPI
jgi:hypothetical protein